MAANGKPLNPYTAHDIAGARAVVETGKDVLELIAKCTRCGNDFSAAADAARAMMDYAQNVINEFESGAEPNV